MESRNTSNIAKIVLDTCIVAKIDTINDLPAMPVSGDVGNGYFCIPASVDDLAWLSHVPTTGRANVLSFALRGAMQKAQAALKAYDKKNKDAKDADRMNAAQTAFAGALNGAVESSFNDSSLIRSEAVRVFMDTKVKPYAESKGLPTDVDALNKVRESIEKSNAANYKTSIDTLIASVRESRTYAVSRKTSVDGVAIDTSDFPL
jgi:hypothetical protein